MNTLPLTAGIGLRGPHYREVLENCPDLGWIEVHTENFLGGGQAPHMLGRLRERWPVSLHGVGLGLGSPARPDPRLLANIRTLIQTIEPSAVSEHLAANHGPAHYINDLLPIPRTTATLVELASRIDEVQTVLGHRLLLENLSAYGAYPGNDYGEGEFLAALVERSGCGILLDVNNLYVNHVNLGEDIDAFLDALPAEAIGEIHLAGYSERDGILVDTHSHPVSEPVWALYRTVLQRFGARPTLIERDQAIPPLKELLAEAQRARSCLEEHNDGQ